MATTPAALPAMEAPGSSDAQWNSTFQNAFPDTGDTAPAAEETPAAEESPAEEAPAEPEPPAEEPVDEAPEQPETPDPELDEADELKPDKVSPDGKTLHFSKQKASRLLAARDFQDKVLSAVPNATPEVLAENYKSAVMAEMMVSDFNSGDPERVGKFANFWVGRDANPDAVASFLDTVSRLAPQAHPQAWQVIEQRANASLIDGLYAKATQSQGDASDFFLKLAQNLDHALTGRFRQKEQIGQQQSGKSSREAELEAQIQQFQQRSAQEKQQRVDAYMKDLDASVDGAILEEIEKALEPVAQQFKNTPRWKYMVGDLKEQVETARKAATTWTAQFNGKRSEAKSTLSDESKKTLGAMMRQFVQPVIAKNRKAIIETHTGTVMQQNAAAHQKAQQTANRNEPAGSQSPVARTTHKQKLLEAKSVDDMFKISAGRAFNA